MSSITDEPKTPQPVTNDAKSANDEYADAEDNFQPRSFKFWSIIIGIYLAIFLVALDRLIIATAIPSITNEFNSIQDIGWYGSAYMFTAAIFNPIFGRLFQIYSTKWTYIASLVIFEVGSALCGAAPSSIVFIVGRAIAGIGAAGIFCGGIVMMIPLVPLRRRPTFTAFFGLAFGVSSILGPLIGGAFTDNRSLTWRWCFYLNLPIGAFTILSVFFFLHLPSAPHEPLSLKTQILRLDPLGVFLFAPSIISLILALQWGGTTRAWSSPTIIGLLTTSAILLLLFLTYEFLTPATALTPRRILLNRSVAGAMLFIFFLAGALMVLVYYLTLWFQAAQNQSAIASGLRTLPLLLSFVVFGIVAAKVTESIGYYVPALLVAPVLCATGAGLLSTLTPTASQGAWIGFQVLFGLGIGAGFQTATLAPQNVLARADVPLGMGLMFFMQQLGGAVFVAVAQNILAGELVGRLKGVAGLDPMAIVNVGATEIRLKVPGEDVGVVVEAYSGALTKTFVLAAVLSAIMVLGAGMVEWKSIKGQKRESRGLEKKEEVNPESEKSGENK